MTQGTLKKPGRPKFELTDAMLKEAEDLSAHGLNQRQIAEYFGVSEITIIRRKKDNASFVDALKKGKARGIATITNALFKSAKSGNITAQIFYLKCVAGFRDNLEIVEAAEIEKEAQVTIRTIYNMEMGDAVDEPKELELQQ